MWHSVDSIDTIYPEDGDLVVIHTVDGEYLACETFNDMDGLRWSRDVETYTWPDITHWMPIERLPR